MAQRRRAPGRSGSATPRRTRRRRGRGGLPLPSVSLGISPAVARSLVGIVLLVLGAMLLIALALPGDGTLTDWVRDAIVPFFGAGRWLLPFVLLVAGWYVEWGPGKELGAPWGRTLAGIGLAYVSFLGLLQIVAIRGVDRDAGGRIGAFLERLLIGPGAGRGLLPVPAAIVILVAGLLVGLLLAFDMPLRQLLRPITGTGRAITSSLSDARQERAARAVAVGPGKATNGTAAKGTTATAGLGSVEPVLTAAANILDQPPSRIGPAPVSQTVVTPDLSPADRPARRTSSATALISDEPQTALAALQAIDWTLPDVTMLEARPAKTSGPVVDHAANIRRIEEKLHSFAIPAKVVATNSGPVVTQYEVRPEHHIKVSRIEALADDLAMALAARSIRIEAPIPGKDVVGIEIPNDVSEVVGFRPLVEERMVNLSASPLTFALGRDVSGEPYAVDLAKMPHLLVAGATGSGKSVCVNALITSILMRARPDEVRMILVDLKRVELAPYNGLPHLLQHVIVEPGEAKAVLNWAVTEMETRYKLLAAHTVRNIGAFNSRPDLEPNERMPYIVLIIDELADLIMREGRKVEDPIVKIAQKARAVGIHLVLATQRPSVNVVTGLIKANVPSRIAFAMASMVDSRTVLDSPGAEDLIGRGDMLYQPVDLPRPVRMQGVFVSDREVTAVTKHWMDQTAGRTFYDEDILAFTDSDGEGDDAGRFAWLVKLGVDAMTPAAAELVTTSNKASTSFLQTKLKLGFARASRVMDELERYGIISPQDPRNPAAVRQVYGRENWFTSTDEVDSDE